MGISLTKPSLSTSRTNYNKAYNKFLNSKNKDSYDLTSGSPEKIIANSYPLQTLFTSKVNPNSPSPIEKGSIFTSFDIENVEDFLLSASEEDTETLMKQILSWADSIYSSNAGVFDVKTEGYRGTQTFTVGTTTNDMAALYAYTNEGDIPSPVIQQVSALAQNITLVMTRWQNAGKMPEKFKNVNKNLLEQLNTVVGKLKLMEENRKVNKERAESIKKGIASIGAPSTALSSGGNANA